MPVDSRLMPKLSTITNASGANMISIFEDAGAEQDLLGSAADCANSKATMPVSSTPDAM